MIVRSIFAAVATSALLTACQATLQPAPTPSVKVAQPAEDVPANCAQFAGSWTGTWGGVLDGKIAIHTVHPSCEVEAVYSWGDHPQGRFPAGSVPRSGMIDGNTLTLEPMGNGAIAKYTMRANGQLEGNYDLNGDVTTGYFDRAGTESNEATK